LGETSVLHVVTEPVAPIKTTEKDSGLARHNLFNRLGGRVYVYVT